MKSTNLNSLPEIPGVDQVKAQEPGSRMLAGVFYIDQLDMLVQMAKAARDRATQGRIYIAPDGEGFAIFRRKRA